MAEPAAEEVHRRPGADPGLDRFEAFLERLKTNWQVLAGLAGAILLTTGVAAGWVSFSEGRQSAAQADLGQLLQDFEDESRDPSAGHEACIEFAKDHDGTHAADHARYLGALWLERGEKLDAASDELGDLAGDLDGSSVLLGPVRVAQARLLEAAERPGEAAEIHLARIEDAGEAGVSEAVVLAAARTLEQAGRVDEAREVLEQFIENASAGAPGAGRAPTWARARLAMLGGGA